MDIKFHINDHFHADDVRVITFEPVEPHHSPNPPQRLGEFFIPDDAEGRGIETEMWVALGLDLVLCFEFGSRHPRVVPSNHLRGRSGETIGYFKGEIGDLVQITRRVLFQAKG